MLLSTGKCLYQSIVLKAQNISLSPQAPSLSYINVEEFGEIYTDNFVFETSLKNNYHEGSSICQMTNIYLLCEGTAVGIPLCAKVVNPKLIFSLQLLRFQEKSMIILFWG